MSERREPLSSLDLNVNASSSSSPLQTPTARVKKLAPIFTRSYRRVVSTPTSTNDGHGHDGQDERCSSTGPPVKRARLDFDSDRLSSVQTRVDEDDSMAGTSSSPFLEKTKDTQSPCPEARSSGSGCDVGDNDHDMIARPGGPGAWRRRRGKLGLSFPSTFASTSSRVLSTGHRDPYFSTPPAYLDDFVCARCNDPLRPTSQIFIPSYSYQRDFAPPLAIAFSHSANLYSAIDAKSAGLKRLVAVAAEEGAVKILDVDEAMGDNRDAKGTLWRAHGNAIMDVKWSRDDARILTASGDQTARLHAFDSSDPTLLASLTGHTASLKTCTFFDPSRSASASPSSGDVIATGSRDGHILIFDVRAPGKLSKDTGRRRSLRNLDGPDASGKGQEIGPVMQIRSAHGDGTNKPKHALKSVTSLVALQSMPGMLASGGSFDGVVQLWDPRLGSRNTPLPIGSLPDPTRSPGKQRSRGIHALVESPVTGDLFALTGAHKVYTMRPSAGLFSANDPDATRSIPAEAIQPLRFSDPDLVSTFWMGLAISPDGRYLASGSAKGGLMTWDTLVPRTTREGVIEITAKSLSVRKGMETEKEITAVDWGHDILAAAEDCSTRLWRHDSSMAAKVRSNTDGMGEEWGSVIE